MIGDRNMRVAMISAAPIAGDGPGWGAGLQVAELSAALAGRGHELHLFGPAATRRSYYQQLGGLHYHVIGRDNRRTSWWNDLVQASLYYLRATERVAGPFDVVHGHHRALLPVLGAIKGSGHARTFLTLHSDVGICTATNGRRDESWHPLDAVTQVTTSSRAIKEKLVGRLALAEERVHVVYPGVTLSKYSRWVDQGRVKERYGFGPLDPTILFVGEMSRATGPDILLEAAFEAMHHSPHAKLVFVGDGPMLPYLKDRAATLGVAPALRFLGFVDEERLIDLYNACDLVCLPFRAGRAEQTVLEAWCAGKTAVVSRAAAPEFLDPTADGIVTRSEVAAVAEAISSSLSDEHARQEMGRRVWHRASNEFSWEAIASRISQMYAE